MHTFLLAMDFETFLVSRLYIRVIYNISHKDIFDHENLIEKLENQSDWSDLVLLIISSKKLRKQPEFA